MTLRFQAVAALNDCLRPPADLTCKREGDALVGCLKLLVWPTGSMLPWCPSQEADYFYVPIYSSCYIFPIHCWADGPWWHSPSGAHCLSPSCRGVIAARQPSYFTPYLDTSKPHCGDIHSPHKQHCGMPQRL